MMDEVVEELVKVSNGHKIFHLPFQLCRSVGTLFNSLHAIHII